ncbi:MAG: UvrD-helicase domain-containing protein [Flavobacteriaceae bacterium]
MSENTFVVYNASAGSGKTYTLVRSYLKALFSSRDIHKYKRILAITFTNKAVAEMKGRILDNLKAFSDPKIVSESVPDNLKDARQVFDALTEDLQISQEELHKKAIKTQGAILNNYAAFDVVTIDTFTHRLIRTFAYDLKLPQNFEVALDTEEVLQEAVNNVLNKVGEDDNLTKLLIDFAVQKADDDKSWDISLDLYNVSKLLLNENEAKHLKAFKDKTLDDFEMLKTTLSKKIKTAEEKIVKIAENRLLDFESKGIVEGDLKPVFGYFTKLVQLNFKIKYDAVWQTKLINGDAIYPKRIASGNGKLIDEIQSEIASDFEETKTLFYELSFLRNFKKNVVPLSVLNIVHQEIERIKEEQNILLISEFNHIISNEIKNQPTPFIYERIGERYSNYFIDEFQDTSELQWQNLIPLAENALASEPIGPEQNSLLIVGDAKQAIYRWRGGKPEQFIDLYEGKRPFFIENQVENLDTNYRSYSEVIKFNNNFFSYLSNKFHDATHQRLYKEGNQQKTTAKNGGYVNISFVDNVVEEEAVEQYQDKVFKTIQNVLDQGFCKADICIITRTKKSGIAIADYLAEHKIDIISSETLLLSKSEEVRFIISFLQYIVYPQNKIVKIEVLKYLYKKMNVADGEHMFYTCFINLSPREFFEQLAEQYQVNFDFNSVETLPFYELVEQVIRTFNLVKKSNAYVQYFLDEVQLFAQKKSTGIHGFLEYWELKKDKLSIVAPNGGDAVTLMTIHKSKGLEFPVVILPFAELDVFKETNPTIWYPIKEDEFNGFSEAFLNFNKDVESFGKTGQILWKNRRTQLELDNINLLYVALTRPREQLYIISKNNVDKAGAEKDNFFSGFFIGYLKSIGVWHENTVDYEFGSTVKNSSATEIGIPKELGFISSSRMNHNLSVLTKNGYLWDTNQQEAIERGNLMHLILSKIKYKSDVNMVFEELESEGTINPQQSDNLRELIMNVITNPGLSEYFEVGEEVYNERPILTKEGGVLIPDRLNIKNNVVSIIDYKTGSYNIKHEHQVNTYENALLEMNYTIGKKMLVYLADEIKIVDVCS